MLRYVDYKLGLEVESYGKYDNRHFGCLLDLHQHLLVTILKQYQLNILLVLPLVLEIRVSKSQHSSLRLSSA